MPEEERRVRMRALRERVFAYDVHHWTRTFLETLERVRSPERPEVQRPSTEAEIGALVAAARRAEDLLVLLGYDGTLVHLASAPSRAVPDPALRDLLVRLAARPATKVHLVSGRTREALDRWFGELPIGLHAEHGLWSRAGPGSPWVPRRDVPQGWRERLRPIFEQYVARTPGSFLEEKTGSIAWHYRAADVEFGALQAKELRLDLLELLANSPFEVLHGEKVVELRLFGVNKGLVVAPLLREGAPAGILALGDDRTDEDLFAALPAEAFTVHVGPAPSMARYRLPDPPAARALLRALLD
jgi:trehalose 6-phosphate synthase/phosphatase